MLGGQGEGGHDVGVGGASVGMGGAVVGGGGIWVGVGGAGGGVGCGMELLVHDHDLVLPPLFQNKCPLAFHTLFSHIGFYLILLRHCFNVYLVKGGLVKGGLVKGGLVKGGLRFSDTYIYNITQRFVVYFTMLKL